MSGFIYGRNGATAAMLAVFEDKALVQTALAFEAALAKASAEEHLIPPAHAAVIAAACRDWQPDGAMLAQQAAHAGTLAIPLVAALRDRVAAILPDAASAVHRGATSQDLADTALMVQAKDALGVLRADLAPLLAALRALAWQEAATPMAGRTLLQQALPITFGLKAAGWHEGVTRAAARLGREADAALALQFGGAAGTRVGLQGKGSAIAARMAASLGLADPALPWHSRRDAVAGLGAALAILTGSLGKIARDLSLLAQTEIAEAHEPRVPGRGGSSAMAHKRNPTACQEALSAALRAPGLAATLMAGLPAEHERGLGGWQAEAPVIAQLFGLAHTAAAALLPVITDLDIDRGAMGENLRRAGIGTDTGEAQAMVAAALGTEHSKKAVLF